MHKKECGSVYVCMGKLAHGASYFIDKFLSEKPLGFFKFVFQVRLISKNPRGLVLNQHHLNLI
jgi:hypothetical protein